MQSKKHSLYEILANQFIGQIISIVFCVFVLNIPIFTSIGATLFFTFASIVRSYVIRRIFNRFED